MHMRKTARFFSDGLPLLPTFGAVYAVIVIAAWIHGVDPWWAAFPLAAIPMVGGIVIAASDTPAARPEASHYAWAKSSDDDLFSSDDSSDSTGLDDDWLSADSSCNTGSEDWATDPSNCAQVGNIFYLCQR
jgi:hypothetical protein